MNRYATYESVPWSEDKQRQLHEQLKGPWAEDAWIFIPTNPKRDRRYMRFTLTSSTLKMEVKYAMWSNFDSGQWKINTRGAHPHLCTALAVLIEWFNHFTPPIQSLMEKNLDQWEVSLRSYLVQTRRFKQRTGKTLSARQKYVDFSREDPRILLLRHLYSIIYEAYDDRQETEKDLWDMRKMGLSVNLTTGENVLNFTLISQPWLRHLAKAFMKYNLAVHSPGDCILKLTVIRGFSRFLEKHYPASYISDIDRTMILQYINFLQESCNSEKWRKTALISLRIFFETSAYYLQIEGITREQIIFDSDIPKLRKHLSREIPEEVLKQLRKHLDTLDTSMLRMVVVLLECGMRISELCTLPLDCLICDDKHDWYLRFYQKKSKKEHIIPLVNTKVVGTIQTQQQEIRERWGQACPYLFPSIESHTSPFKQNTFRNRLNRWAVEKGIRNSVDELYRFQSHQFRHTVGMRLINDDVPLDIISRLLGHSSVGPTEVYAQKRASKVREELERVARIRKMVNHKGEVINAGTHANDPHFHLVHRGIRGQTLPVGGCGRPVVSGDCEHANKCLTCPFWLTSTDDLPGLKAFYTKAIRLKQLAIESGNQWVVKNQDHIIPNLAIRIAKLEDTSMDSSLSVEELLIQLQADLIEAESALEELCEAGLLVAVKHLERIIFDLKAEIAALEGSL